MKHQVERKIKLREMRMKMWLPLLLLLSLLCPCIPQPIPLHCPDKCGNISIPYPFGVGDVRCAKNQKFLLRCNNGQPLLLGSIPLRDISLHDGTVTVITKTKRQCFSNYELSEETFYGGIDLRDSPFVFFDNRNRFVVLGCNITALIDNHGEYQRACLSFCRRGYSRSAALGFCTTSLPSKLKTLNFTLFGMDPPSDPKHKFCLHAFVAAKSTYNISKINLSKHPVTTQVTLQWVVGKEKCKASGNRSGTYACGENTECQSSKNGPGYRCLCKQGFQGNPYLPEGCQDINECDDPSRYQCDGFCENRAGGYTCRRYDESEVNSRRHDGTILALAIILSIGFLLLIAGIYSLNALVKKKKTIQLKKKFFKSNGGLLLQQQISSDKGKLEKLKIFSSEELEKATDYYNENRILGKGGQGIVYKGMLPDGSVVAVKKSKRIDKAQIEHFINEVVILSQINHRHVVKLLGCCLETVVPLLVYEFISNGTLSNHIHDQMEESPMKWSDRLRIAKEVAGALAYMHSAADVPIYHRDIKSSNILVDGKYGAKLSDFGISRSVPTEKSHLTTRVQGTFGYLDPEYFQTNQYTEKSDVYSFGVVLVELLTGQKPISSLRPQDMGLAAHFISSVKEKRLFDVLDPQVVMEGEKEDLLILANLAMRCLKLNGRKRPTMRQVSLELENLKKPKQHLPAELSYQEEDYFFMESSSRSLDPRDEARDESIEEIRDELEQDIQERLTNSLSFTNKSD